MEKTGKKIASRRGRASFDDRFAAGTRQVVSKTVDNGTENGHFGPVKKDMDSGLSCFDALKTDLFCG